MAISIPFPLPAAGYALNSKVRVNLDFLVDKFNEFNSGTATWDAVAVGTGGSLTGVVTLYNSTNLNYLSLQAGVTDANITYTLPAAAPAYNNSFLKSTTAGVMAWSFLNEKASYVGDQLIYPDGNGTLQEVAVGTGNKVLVNSTPPSFFSLLGTANQITVTPSAGAFTLSLPQDIDATASPTFAGMKLEGGSAASPSLVIYLSPSAQNTGLYATANTINFTTAGVLRAYIDETDGIVSASGIFAAGEVRGATLRVDSSTGTGVQIQTAASTSWTLTLPTNDGDVGQVLQTDGSGVTSWVTASDVTDHNTLTGLQGGSAAEYYHLTSAQHTIATQAASTTVSGYITTGIQNIAGTKTFASNTNDGTTYFLSVQNSLSTAGSSAALRATVASANSGDPRVDFFIGDGDGVATDWTLGVDNSDSDSFKICVGDALGTNDFLKISTAGAVTLAGALSGVTTLGCGAITTTGNLAVNKASPQITLTDSGTAPSKITLANGTTLTYLAQEGSVAGTTTAGSSAYASIFSAGNVYDLQLATNNVVRMTISGAGEITQPSQPSFLVYTGSTLTDVTGDGTDYTVAFNTEVYDQGADVSSGTFTAPVTGRYLLTAGVTFNNLGAAHTEIQLSIVCSNRGAVRYRTQLSTVTTYYPVDTSVVVDMDAGDTAYVAAYAAGSAKNVDLFASGTALYNFFSGSLIN